ncbi:MAG TPA: alpha/beta hydrolase, partial [Kofleriaceae bacterium]
RYAAIGRGEPAVVILNAFGQTVAPWLPLIERLSRHRRVLLWEPREAGAGGTPVTFVEHCEDLAAILAQERARPCHLVGWCTGAKLAARYCRMDPGAVASQVMLGGSFKHAGRAPELDTPYERNLEAVLQAVAHEPALAERLRRVLVRTADGEVDLDRLDGHALAHHAVTRVPDGLKQEIRQPFRDAASLRVYARQHLDFWSFDETASAPHTPVPTLGVTGQHDQIVSPAGFRAAVERFPVSRFHAVAATTHHCFHERPDAVAELIESWIGLHNSAQRHPAPHGGIDA